MKNNILILFVLYFNIISQVRCQTCSSTSPFNVAYSCCSGSLSMPNSVTSIVAYAYYGCNHISSLIVASTVRSIGFGVFDRCSSLTQVTLISGLTVIGENMFAIADKGIYPTLLASIIIPSTITSIGGGSFYACTYLSLVGLTSGLTVIGYAMFFMWKYPTVLASITIPSTITSIGGAAFQRCTSLTQVTFISGLTVIGEYMIDPGLEYPSPTLLTTVTIPSTITSIGDGPFRLCTSLSQVTFTSGLAVIGAYMFIMYYNGDSLYTSSLASLTIPSTITSIGSKAFAYNTALKCVYWLGSVINSPVDIFYSSPNAATCSFSPTKQSTLPPSSSPTTILCQGIPCIGVCCPHNDVIGGCCGSDPNAVCCNQFYDTFVFCCSKGTTCSTTRDSCIYIPTVIPTSSIPFSSTRKPITPSIKPTQPTLEPSHEFDKGYITEAVYNSPSCSGTAAISINRFYSTQRCFQKQNKAGNVYSYYYLVNLVNCNILLSTFEDNNCQIPDSINSPKVISFTDFTNHAKGCDGNFYGCGSSPVHVSTPSCVISFFDDDSCGILTYTFEIPINNCVYTGPSNNLFLSIYCDSKGTAYIYPLSDSCNDYYSPDSISKITTTNNNNDNNNNNNNNNNENNNNKCSSFKGLFSIVYHFQFTINNIAIHSISNNFIFSFGLSLLATFYLLRFDN